MTHPEIPLIATRLEVCPQMEADFWFDSNVPDDGVTPARPTRGSGWQAPSGYPSAEHPYTWSRA